MWWWGAFGLQTPRSYWAICRRCRRYRKEYKEWGDSGGKPMRTRNLKAAVSNNLGLMNKHAMYMSKNVINWTINNFQDLETKFWKRNYNVCSHWQAPFCLARTTNQIFKKWLCSSPPHPPKEKNSHSRTQGFCKFKRLWNVLIHIKTLRFSMPATFGWSECSDLGILEGWRRHSVYFNVGFLVIAFAIFDRSIHSATLFESNLKPKPNHNINFGNNTESKSNQLHFTQLSTILS